MWRLGSYRDDPGADSGVFTKGGGGGGSKLTIDQLSPPPSPLHLRFQKKIIREKHERRERI